ncbi:hypothetical protein COT64_02310, partial [Candidatus Shapirobacteria bacterium CG09_land_8_20_14_0_10_39_12]
GKTATICLLARDFKGFDFAVYKHRLDLTRTGLRLRSHTGELWAEAGLYKSLAEVDCQKQILLIDEFQFESESSPEEIKDFLSSVSLILIFDVSRGGTLRFYCLF